METWLDLPAVFRCMFAHLGLGICAEFSVSTFSCSGFPFAFVSGVEITGAIPTQVPHFSAIFLVSEVRSSLNPSLHVHVVGETRCRRGSSSGRP